MKENIKFSETENTLTIEISPSIKPIVKFGLVFQGIILFALAIGLAIFLVPVFSELPIIALVFGAFCFIIPFAGKKYLNRVIYKEIIEVRKDYLTIIDKFLFSKKVEKFLIPEISNIGYAGQHKFTKHPLDSSAIDYTGFGVAESEVQYLIEDGTIKIFCNGMSRRFGKNIDSWDAEEIVTRIERFTGNNLNLDDKMEEFLDQLNKEI